MSEKTLPASLSFLLSGLSSALSKTAGAPFERLRLVLQCETELLGANTLEHTYGSGLAAFRSIVKHEGVAGLWRGNVIAVVRYVPMQSLTFTVREYLTGLSHTRRHRSTFSNPLTDSNSNGRKMHGGFFEKWCIGAVSGLTATLLLYSADYVRTLLANDILTAATSTRQFKGIADAYTQTVRLHGFRTLYTGFPLCSISVVLYRGFYFGLYDHACTTFLRPKEGSKKSFGGLPKMGVAYGGALFASFFAYPFDTVRRRMIYNSFVRQRSGAAAEKHPFRSSLSAWKHVWRTDGLRPMYNGFAVNIVRSVSSSMTIVLFDFFKSRFLDSYTVD